jgi:ribonuclease BN (tRNA processing enzyme)
LQSLRRYLDPLRLDAVVISHFHPDHVFDLVPLRYLRAFASEDPKMLDVFIPAGEASRMQKLALATASSEHERFFARSMNVVEYDPRGELRIGGLQLAFAAARHYIEAYAIRVSDGRAAVTYSSDTAPCDAVVELARGSDVFLCECALGATEVDREPRGHSNASEAAEMAARAGVKHLVLTHYGDGAEPDVLAAAASARFDGTVTVAEDGWCITL